MGGCLYNIAQETYVFMTVQRDMFNQDFVYCIYLYFHDAINPYFPIVERNLHN